MEEEKTFKDLGVDDELVEACENLGWKSPTKIQIEAIPIALGGKDIIGFCQTGSGKTGAFVIPIIQALLEAPQSIFACVISPTRELAIRISEQFQALGAGKIGLKTIVLVDGVDHVEQSIALAERPHIVVATPDRLVHHLSNTQGFSLRNLKFLVLDEADRFLDDDLESLNLILSCIPLERRTYLFTATMNKKVKKMQRVCLKNPRKVLQ